MLIGICGSFCAGKSELTRYLKMHGFQELKIRSGPAEGPAVAQEFPDVAQLIDYATRNWQEKFVIGNVNSLESYEALAKRPFYLHVSIDASLLKRWKRYAASEDISLEDFAIRADTQLYGNGSELLRVMGFASVKIVNNFDSVEELFIHLSALDLSDLTRLRPSWDAYFMRLADLAALRSNCMKRRVGCVIVRDKRVVSTGYNGTPRGLKNCNEGGCVRCNDAQGSGAGLSTCLCLHAEENALLEAGRDRIRSQTTIYCNTCPCLTCSIKIVQSGVEEVVYSQSYSMDEQSFEVLKKGGVVLRRYRPPVEGYS